MNAAAARIRAGIAILAIVILAGLLGLRAQGADETLLRILAIAGGLLVALLFVTYRALLRMAEAARAASSQPHRDDKDVR